MNYYTTVLSLAGLNMLLALSVYVTLATGQFSLASVGFWALGAYCTATLTTLFGWPLWAALGASASGCALISIVLGFPCLRLRGFYLALATLGFSEMVRVGLQNLEFQRAVAGVAMPVGPSGVTGFRNVAVTSGLWDIAGFLVVLACLLSWMNNSRLGLAFSSTRQDETVAGFMGINVVRTKVGAFMLSAAIAATGGGLYAGITSYISADDFGFHMSLLGVLFVAIGGMRTFYGPMLAAAVLTILPELFRFLADYRMTIYGLLVIVLMIWRPNGLIDGNAVAWFRRRLNPRLS